MRYVAFVTPDYAGWLVLFPDFPDIAAKGLLLEDALRRARRELSDRAHLLRILGSPMPKPQRAEDLVQSPLYRHSMVAIIAVPGPWEPEDGNLSRFG
jgi:hypothetical protein